MAFLLMMTCLVSCVSGSKDLDSEPGSADSDIGFDESPDYSDRILELELIGYNNAVSRFVWIDAVQASEKSESGENYYLFVGRETCQWCRIIAPDLQEAAYDAGIEMFYLDSTDSESDQDLSEFRKKYEIDSVPAVVRFRNGGFTHLRFDLASESLYQDLLYALECEGSGDDSLESLE